MTPKHARHSSIDSMWPDPTPFTTRLTREQLSSLRECAKGISLRFERPEIVNALIAGGYAERNVAGVVTVTAKGHKYLRAHGY
jgi:hypothetical protein